MQAKTIAEIASDMLSDRVKVDMSMWMVIIDRMYEDKDVLVLKEKIQDKALQSYNIELEKQKEQPRGGSRSRERSEKRVSSKNPISHRSQPESQLVLSDLVKVIQDFQLQEHENFLSNFMSLFRAQDEDRDGILNPDQFQSLLLTMNIGITQKQTDAFVS